MNSRFTKKAQNALNKALYYAREMGHNYIGSEHLLLGLLSETDGIAYRVLTGAGITLEKTRLLIEKSAGVGSPSTVSAADMTPRTKNIIEGSANSSASLGHSYIGTEHILLAILKEEDCFAMQIIGAEGGSSGDMEREIMNCLGADSAVPHGGEKTAKSNAVKGAPNLSAHGRNLCNLAKEGKIDPIIGRDAETERVIQILSRRTKNNPCLIGEPGVGKTAVVEGLAMRIVEGNVPETLRGKQIITLDISSMVAGAKYRGEFEERMQGVMEEVRQNPSVILFIDEIHTIIGAGGAEGAVDAANIIKPALARGEMQVIGATTVDEYRRHIEKDAALERRFQSVTVGEPTPEEAVEILRGLRDKYEAHHKLKISDEAIEAAVKLSVRYIGDRYLPDKAIDLIDEAASKMRIKNFTAPPEVKEIEERLKRVSAEKEEAILGENFEEAASLRDKERQIKEELEEKRSASPAGNDGTVVSADEICDIVTAWTGIPVKKLGDEEGERLLHLDEILRGRIIGQDAAVDAVAKAIRRGRVGLKDPKRPIGSFIFLGPTGVGKTELTKALADVMFGDENAMIRVDMSEYMEKHSTSKLIGSPPGYVGYDDGGQLTEKIRRHPYSVVLFDEIEKAHPDVFNILLQILEDGILTDSKGRRVDFKNTAIIMTSNVGASGIVQTKRLGFAGDSGIDDGAEAMKTSVMDALKGTFRPEFLNRVDEIIIFNKLTDGDIRKIAGLMLEESRRRIGENGIEITFGDDVTDMLAREGFDPVYGARPLRRAIVRRVEDSLSEAMLSGLIKNGDKVEAYVENGKILYRVV